MRDIRMYILVNQDIKMSKGELAGQVGHAIEQMLYNQIRITGKILPAVIEYMNNDQKKVILYCPQEKLEELEYNGYVSIRGKGLTGPASTSITCVNIGLSYCDGDFTDDLKFVKDLKPL